MNLLSKNRADNFFRYKWLCDPILANWIVDILQPYGKKLLDVGCGNGYMFDYYASRFAKIGAVEPSPSLKDIAQKKADENNILFKVGCAEKIPFANKEFDIVIAKSSLHHFMDVDQGLLEMDRVSNNVIAVVEVVAPNDYCIPFLQGLLIQKEKGRKAESVYTAETLKSVVGKIQHKNDVYQHYFDQYIEIDTWLKYSDLTETEKKKTIQYILETDKETMRYMQFHERGVHICMLRRMCLTFVFK